MATKKPNPAATAASKPTMVKRKINGKTMFVPANGKLPKPTLEAVIAERDKYQTWWSEGFQERERLKKTIEELRSALSAVALIVKAAKPIRHDFDDDTPF